MSSDPKKPGFDAPPSGTPDLLQKDLNLDRRRRVPTFEELQAQKSELATDPLRPAVPRPPAPIPQTTVPVHPNGLDAATQNIQKHVPPGLAPRQPPPALHIRTPTPPTQPARMAIPPEALPTQTQPRPMPIPPAAVPPQQARPPMPPQARPPAPPPAPAAVTRPIPPAAAGPQTNTIPVRTPAPAPPNTIPVRTPAPAAQPNTIPVRTPVPRGTHEQTGMLPQQPPRPPPDTTGLVQQQPPRPPPDTTGLVPQQRTAPPSPTEFAQARPQVMPQVTPAGLMQGAMAPEGQVPVRPSQVGLPTVPAPAAPRVIEPEPRTVPAGQAAPRSFTPPPAPAPVPRPAQLPPEMMVTQPGAPGPFMQSRSAPPTPAPMQRAPSRPELPRPPSRTELPPAPEPVSEGPVFAPPQFDEPQLASSDTVTAEPAALWRRTGAWIADLAIVGGIVLGFLMLAMTVIAPKNVPPLQQLTAVAIPGVALGAVLAFVYTTLFAFLWNGRTPGRRLMGIHLVDVTGHAPSPARALMRAAFSLVSFGLFLSGFWLALFDRHGQTLHDKLTRTFVVKLQDA